MTLVAEKKKGKIGFWKTKRGILGLPKYSVTRLDGPEWPLPPETLVSRDREFIDCPTIEMAIYEYLCNEANIGTTPMYDIMINVYTNNDRFPSVGKALDNLTESGHIIVGNLEHELIVNRIEKPSKFKDKCFIHNPSIMVSADIDRKLEYGRNERYYRLNRQFEYLEQKIEHSIIFPTIAAIHDTKRSLSNIYSRIKSIFSIS